MKFPINKQLNYFIYARKSTEGEDKQMASIDDQIFECKKIAQTMGLHIIDIISESKSAKEPGRPAFQNMLSRIHKDEAQGILCWKLNRLARNPVDGGQISWMLQQGFIQHIQTYGRDYKPSDNVILMQVEFGMANQYVKDLSVDTQRGMRRKAERGWFPSGVLPMGYKHNYPEAIVRGEDEIIPNEHFVRVQKLWKLFATSLYSITDLKRKGDALGIRNKKGNVYSLNTYRSIFTNEFYTGFYYWKNEEGLAVRLKGKHKAMIDLSTFEAVQRHLKASERKDKRERDYFFPFRGVIRCGECGCQVTAERKQQAICTTCKTKFSIRKNAICPTCNCPLDKMKNPSLIDKTYYHCTKRKGFCSQTSVSLEFIQEEIAKHFKRLAIEKDFYDWAIRALKRMSDSEAINSKEEITLLKKQKSDLDNRLTGLRRMCADGIISKLEYEQDISLVRNEMAQLSKQINQLQSLETDWEALYLHHLKFLSEAFHSFTNGDNSKKHQLLSELGSNLVLWNKSLYFSSDLLYQSIKMYEGAHLAQIRRFEPKKSLMAYSDLKHLDTLYSEWLPNLRAIRTLYCQFILCRNRYFSKK